MCVNVTSGLALKMGKSFRSGVSEALNVCLRAKPVIVIFNRSFCYDSALSKLQGHFAFLQQPKTLNVFVVLNKVGNLGCVHYIKGFFTYLDCYYFEFLAKICNITILYKKTRLYYNLAR